MSEFSEVDPMVAVVISGILATVTLSTYCTCDVSVLEC